MGEEKEAVRVTPESLIAELKRHDSALMPGPWYVEPVRATDASFASFGTELRGPAMGWSLHTAVFGEAWACDDPDASDAKRAETKAHASAIAWLRNNASLIASTLRSLSERAAVAERERDEIQATLTTVEHEVARVYCHITNGKISKCNTAAEMVIAVSDDMATADVCEDKRDAERFRAIAQMMIGGDAREGKNFLKFRVPVDAWNFGISLDARGVATYADALIKLAAIPVEENNAEPSESRA